MIVRIRLKYDYWQKYYAKTCFSLLFCYKIYDILTNIGNDDKQLHK